MSAHRCHALDCAVEVPPKMFMCLRHWRMVPSALKRAVWANYRPGQEADKRPTSLYLIVTEHAINEVARKEALTRRAKS